MLFLYMVSGRPFHTRCDFDSDNFVLHTTQWLTNDRNEQALLLRPLDVVGNCVRHWVHGERGVEKWRGGEVERKCHVARAPGST